MPQQIIMSDNGQADIEKMRDILYSLMDFGIIHEDLVNTIEDHILQLVNEQVGLGGLQPDYEKDKGNYEDEDEYLQENFGSSAAFEIIELMRYDESLLTAKCTREIMGIALFSDSYSIDIDYREMLERLK